MREIVRAMRDELQGRDLDYFFLMCVSQVALQEPSRTRMEDVVAGIFEELEVPYVDTRPAMKRIAARARPDDPPLFLTSGFGKGHPSPAGNQVLMDLMIEGMQGSFARGR